jgi:hypothetical protein
VLKNHLHTPARIDGYCTWDQNVQNCHRATQCAEKQECAGLNQRPLQKYFFYFLNIQKKDDPDRTFFFGFSVASHNVYTQCFSLLSLI